ncbi:MAG: putative O-glycosylation ligase, exosortase A system-associated [Planctomycetes bacterium]|nr:putative O-glycosylation ligase, exosortase A system-associated [Planctomycetota bacterium]MCB9904133.1 putative O-glycosylation ligase, exosortase A system-associated [Planctomycetota bacterium]
MRDIVVSLFILGMMPVSFRKPFVGLLLFSLLAYLRLQDLTWGFAQDVRWSFYVAIVTFAGFFASPVERNFMAADIRCYLLCVLTAIVWVSVLLTGDFHSTDMPGLIEYTKIIGIALFTTGLVNTRPRLRMMVWVIAFSFAFFGFKSGLVGVLKGGAYQIHNGPGGMLDDNNDFALALGMGVPLLWMVAHSERRQVIRRMLYAVVPLQMATIAFTHSRGGALALGTGLMVLVYRSRNRLAGFVAIGLLGLVGLAVAPSDYTERLSTIKDYEQDDSAQARLAAWRTAFEMIKDKPLQGVGFARFQRNYKKYDPAVQDRELEEHGSHVSHNSYLQIWAECGTPALFVYLSLIALSLMDLWKIRSLAQQRFHSSWVLNYCTMFEASLVIFLAGSMFLNRAHFDLFYHLIAVIVAFGRIARAELADFRLYPARGMGRGELQAVHAPGFGPRPRPNGFERRPALGGGL